MKEGRGNERGEVAHKGKEVERKPEIQRRRLRQPGTEKYRRMDTLMGSSIDTQINTQMIRC